MLGYGRGIGNWLYTIWKTCQSPNRCHIAIGPTWLRRSSKGSMMAGHLALVRVSTQTVFGKPRTY